MARLLSAGQGQSRWGHWSGRAWSSWPPLPGWGLGHSPAKEWRRSQSSATTATIAVLIFLFSAGVKGDEGVPAPAGTIKGEGVAAGVHGEGGKIKIQVPTYEADATYMRQLAAVTGADRALNWYGDPCYKNWPGINCDGNGRMVGINTSAQGLGGWVPSTKGDDALSWVTELDLHFNELSGPLSVLALPRLNSLYLDGNLFTSLWKFQARDDDINDHLLRALARAGVLDLANNHLTGPVPETFLSPSMQRLNLSNNCLNGSISFIENLPGLAEIRLDNNDFNMLLPDLDEHMLPVVFSVAHNHLTGVVPSSLPRILSSGSSVSLSGNLL
ncbi:hypothetical protein C2845_PM01G31640 [Panicum miliaceum]|uniref:Leucine-rich repeat-containing N-terminal plant-type domain-containing protein n=1 Tax=Panicum miliaceum TaxID=4540 RepID=A0A3L6TSS7_PANMI|nr:hypothetical protein C2845_PM01G31640 [Panicum miliaceum]